MALDLNPLLISSRLLDEGILYRYSTGAENPEVIPSWPGFFVAYTASTLGYRTNASIFLEDATARLVGLPSDEPALIASLNISEKNQEQIGQIKNIAEHILNVCNSLKHNPKIHQIAKSLESVSSKELLRRELFLSAIKPRVVLADTNIEDALINCIRGPDSVMAEVKQGYQRQFEIDVDRMVWFFELESGGYNEYPIASREPGFIEAQLAKTLRANPASLGGIDPSLDLEVQILAKINRIKQLCHQTLGVVLGGSLDQALEAPDRFNQLKNHLILSKMVRLKMESFDERGLWNVNLGEKKIIVSKDLNQITFEGSWLISLTEAQQADPVAKLKASLTIDFQNNELILEPAKELKIQAHASIEDLQNLKLWLTD